MDNKKINLLEEIKRIKSLVDFKYGDLIMEQEETFETFDFSNSYPDNIAFPIRPNSTINSVQDVLKLSNLNQDLVEFITRLKTRLENNIKIGTIRISSGASDVRATANVPEGYNQSIVNYSYNSTTGNQTATAFDQQIKVTISNKVLAINRANFMSWILKSLIPKLKDVNIEVVTNLPEKKVIVQIPTSVMTNFETNKIFKDDYVKTNKTYIPDPKKPSIKSKCNSRADATGNSGRAPEYIADRLKIDLENYNGDVTINYNSFAIPDRFIIKEYDPTTNQFTTKGDTGFVTTVPDDRNLALISNELNYIFGGGQTIKTMDTGTITFKAEPNKEYFVDVVAPIGGTKWFASILCGKKEPEKSIITIKPVTWPNLNATLDPSKEYTFYTDLKGNYYDKQDPSGTLKIYAKGIFRKGSQGPILQNGDFYDYDKEGNQTGIRKIKDGKI